MNELYFPEAIVLDREDANGFDSRYSIYAKGFGKFFAKATSARKITSKLAPHLEPGNLIQIRVVGNGHFQVVDVLKSDKLGIWPNDLYLLNQMLPEHDFEFGVWQELMRNVNNDVNDASEAIERIKKESDGNEVNVVNAGQVHQNLNWRNNTESSPSSQAHSGREPFDWKRVLKVLGWDPEHAACEICNEAKPDFFDIGTQGFFCEKCFAKRGSVESFSFRRTSKDFLKLATSQ